MNTIPESHRDLLDGEFATLATVGADGRFHGGVGPFSPQLVNAHGQVQTLGEQLFTTFLLPFEVTSLLLLVAAVGAVYLSRHRRTGE